MDVKPGGGFVKDKQGVALPATSAEERRQFDALRLATTQGVGTLSQRDVTQTNFLERRQFGKQAFDGRARFDAFIWREELEGIVHRHGQHVGDVLALVGDFQHVVLEPLPVA